MKKILFSFSIIFIFLILIFIYSLYLYSLGYRFNKTSSIPIGIYKLEKSDNYRKGDKVSFCLPDNIVKFGRAKGYIHGSQCGNNSTPIAKEILAVPNDIVEVNSKGVTVNGTFYKLPQQVKDGYGNKVKTNISNSKINGYFMVGTNNKMSWDSRYYGDIPKHNIQGKLNEIFMF